MVHPSAPRTALRAPGNVLCGQDHSSLGDQTRCWEQPGRGWVCGWLQALVTGEAMLAGWPASWRTTPGKARAPSRGPEHCFAGAGEGGGWAAWLGDLRGLAAGNPPPLARTHCHSGSSPHGTPRPLRPLGQWAPTAPTEALVGGPWGRAYPDRRPGRAERGVGTVGRWREIQAPR